MTREEIKVKNLDTVAEFVKGLYKKPQLRHLYFELTEKCNLNCFHCGSSCDGSKGHGLSLDKYKDILSDVKDNVKDKPMVFLTGGEPLLYPSFFELVEHIHNEGFNWGMTSNGLLITDEVAKRLKDAGMFSISISIDGLPESHDRYRGVKGAYDRAMRGIDALIQNEACKNVMVTTVVNHENINELDALLDVMNGIDIDEWRLLGIEPIGRAEDSKDMLLTPDDYKRLMEFVKEKRKEGLPVEYGCCHYLGLNYEVEVRDWYWFCNSGVHTASIRVNGDVTGCLDIPKNSKAIQGNANDTPFSTIWEERFEVYRQPLSARNEKCANCEDAKWCRGGAYHSWDWDNECPKVCLKGVLF